jgi:drug/metabolite transporter (DMT)-like permease
VPSRVPARNPAFGLALVVLGALLFIQNAGVSRVALRAGVDPLTLTTARVTGTLLVLLVAAALFRRDALRPPRGRLGALLVVHGLIGVAALQWTYFVAIDRLPVGMALLLEYQAPILVALWARFAQRERVRPRLWWGLALAWGGLAPRPASGAAWPSTWSGSRVASGRRSPSRSTSSWASTAWAVSTRCG